MTQLARICAAALIAILPACYAQTTTHKKWPDPKPEPTVQDLFEYVRGALLSLGPDDGVNDNVEVAFDPTSTVLKITLPAGHCDLFLNALNTNTAVWDSFDPSDSAQQREKLLRLSLVSLSGKTARICYDKFNHVDTTLTANRARLLFSLAKAEDVPGFQEKLAKAFKKLIVLSGGAPEQDIF